MASECISCRESLNVDYSVENGPGPFCSECWQKLEEYFIPPPPDDGIPKYLLKKPIKFFTIPGSRPGLKGLEVAFDVDGYVGLRVAADTILAFILTPSEFCKQCAATLLNLDQSDFVGLCDKGFTILVWCEGCGPTEVDSEGVCVAADCLERHGRPT